MEKLKKFFKYLFITLVSIILLIVIGLALWWNIKSNAEKSSLMVNAHQYEKAIEYNGKNSNAWMERSVSYNKAGDFEKGFKYLNKAVEIEPIMHLGYRGWIRLRKIRDFDKAIIDFDTLDRLTPNFVDAPWGENIDFLRGECYFGKKEYLKAIDFFNLNIKNNKEDWVDIHTFVYLGLCEYKLGNYQKAVSEFKRALAQSEYTTEASFGISKAYYKLGEIEKAKENILATENNFEYKRNDTYNEFLNEIYLSEILNFKKLLEI
jgi:tetratricopeptide (TPR) repeat protein